MIDKGNFIVECDEIINRIRKKYPNLRKHIKVRLTEPLLGSGDC